MLEHRPLVITFQVFPFEGWFKTHYWAKHVYTQK